jgi:multidrug efflux pump subunit AcrB
MLGLFFVLFGILSFRDLPFVRLNKKIYPGIAIRTDASGFDASRVEQDITTPIERIIAQVGGVRKMTSVSEDGTSLIQVQMEEGLDLKFKSLEFREKIDTILSQFPREVHKPVVYRYDPTNAPLMVISFSKEQMSQDELRELVEKSFKREFESVDGVSQVIVAGGKIREILIACDARQLEAYSFSLRDIVNKFQDINQNDSLGKLTETKEELTLQVREKWKQMLQMRDLPLRVDSLGRIVYLKDIAEISYAPRDDHVGARLNAKEKVSVFIYKNDASDPIRIAKQVQAILSSKNQLKIAIEINQDDSVIIGDTIQAIIELGVVILLLLVLYFYFYEFLAPFFLTYLLSLICVLFSLALFYRLSGQAITLSGTYGIILGCIFWFLFRIREISWKNGSLVFQKKHDLKRFFLGLFVSVFFSLLLAHTIFVFYLTLVLNLFLSFLIVDFYFPILYLNVIAKFKIPNSFRIALVSKYLKLASEFLLQKGKDHLEKTEKPLLSHKLLLPVSLFFLSIVGIVTILRLDVYDNIQSDEKETVAFLEFPSGTAFEHTSQITLQLEKKLIEIPGIKQVVSKIDPAHALLLITHEDGMIPDREFLQSLKSGVGSTDDGFLFFASDMDSTYFQEIVFDVIGYDQAELELITAQLTEKVKNLDGVSEAVLRYKQSREELKLIPKYEAFVESSLTLPLFGDELRLALQGGVATKFIDREKEIDVRVRYSEKYRTSKNDFSSIRIKNTKSRFVPISEIVTTSEDKIPLKYYHKNRSRVLSFSAKLEGNSSRMRETVVQFVKSFPMPEGYHIEVEGEEKSIFSRSDNLLLLLYPLLLSLIFALLLGEALDIYRMVFVIFIPYAFTYFLLQFLFPGPFYLPFQIGMLVSLPITIYLLSRRLNRSIYFVYFLSLTYLLMMVFVKVTLLSFFHLWACIALYFILTSFALRLLRAWESENHVKMSRFAMEQIHNGRQVVMKWMRSGIKSRNF